VGRWVRAMGAVVLVIAVVLLGFAGLTVYEIAKDPSGHLQALRTPLNVTQSGLFVAFRWSSQGYNVTFNATASSNGSPVTAWAWEFGDGPGILGGPTETHTYAVTCPMCDEQVTLGVQDAAGARAVATGEVALQAHGRSTGVGQSPGSQINTPQLGPLTSGIVGGLELVAIMLLVGGSVARAGWNLVRREPETIDVPIASRSVRAG